jgi:Tol biopolymer transport system component
LYSVSATGGTATKINGTLPSGGDVVAGSARFSPNSSRILYIADQQTNDVFELYSAPAAGGTPVKLNGSMVTGGDVSLAGLQFSPDGSRVLYAADQLVNQKVDLFSVPATGGAPVPLTADTPQFAFNLIDLESVTFSSSGSQILFRALLDGDSNYNLFTVPTLGGAPTLLSSDMEPFGSVINAEFAPDGSKVVYLANAESAGVVELFSVASTGGMPSKISGELVAGGNVTHWAISPNSERVAFRADRLEDETYELFSVELAASADQPGDFNDDGVVDAADYSAWRNGVANGLYDETHYGLWRRNYGRGTGTAAGSGGVAAGVTQLPENLSTVPEPAGLWLVGISLVISAISNRRVSSGVRSLSFSV